MLPGPRSRPRDNFSPLAAGTGVHPPSTPQPIIYDLPGEQFAFRGKQVSTSSGRSRALEQLT